ncbi:iron-sulfur cluster carrier protein ApbC [Colwellia sp. UCD-KL20]|uniref:iron-sulfur cluster carrier protein ApbC n=1 Tax=Colwellia sp. UCD-KL20 TaxID=1917165 RepID=UPI000970B361|nr:iron-sulfur cluster carrier protein ApbC [Colwellia sp. UCD-KL20]
MFSKFFSNKSVPQESQDSIMSFFHEYRSDCFRDGILSLSSAPIFELEDNCIVISLDLPFPCDGELDDISDALTELLDHTTIIKPDYQIHAGRQHNLSNIRNIIAVTSGKGGVGKSTTAVNLAYALIAEGSIVGILDADIYGPSLPTMLGLKGQQPSSSNGKSITPLNANGLTAMSVGFLVGDEDATVWRGPMASRAFSQLLNETLWPDLDYLIVDMPPGTGDIQLTLSQSVPVAAAIVVTTPQDIALTDAIKGISMFDKVKVPVLGLVENMSYHVCENCGHQSHLFGENGGVHTAKDKDIPLLGQLPLNINIRQDVDNGNASVLQNSTSDIALLYRKLARNVASELFYQLDARSPNTAEICFSNE